MRYVFGPVPSRRLGQSLGIDPIPLKTCNWNCVYCQLGRTQPLTNQRKDYFPPQEILAEVRQSLDAHQPGEIDWVTFVGSGEPLLHASIGWLVRQVKKITELPVAVITNGSLLYLPEVRHPGAIPRMRHVSRGGLPEVRGDHGARGQPLPHGRDAPASGV